MFRTAKIAFFATALVVGIAATPAFAVSWPHAPLGESLARQLMMQMDTDKNGQVSRDEWMRFMDAEFDRLDVENSGHLSVREIRNFARPDMCPDDR